MVEAFAGKFTVEKRDNFDKFMTAVGVPDEYIQKAREAKVVTEISVNDGVVTVTRIRPLKTTTNSFKIGEDTEVDTIKGDKIKVNITMQGGKMVAKGEKYEVITEMDNGMLKETITLKGSTMTRWSKRS